MPKVDITCPICNGSHQVKLTDAQAQSEVPFVFQCPDLDRRYRLSAFYVETRRNLFNTDKPNDASDRAVADLRSEFGEHDFASKFARWKQIDYPPLGLIDEYPGKLSQIVNTFSIGYSYPAVTSACCLAERILNRLVLQCRSHFKNHPDYKKIYRKDSFDDWGRMLGLIEDWNLISPKAITLFRELMPVRHETIHYNEAYDFDAVAADVVNKLIAAVTEIFGVVNRKDLFMVFDVPGEVWVRSDAEALPFVREFVIQHCYYAHAVHDVDFAAGKITERLGKTGPLTDDEFVELRKDSLKVTPPDSKG